MPGQDLQVRNVRRVRRSVARVNAAAPESGENGAPGLPNVLSKAEGSAWLLVGRSIIELDLCAGRRATAALLSGNEALRRQTRSRRRAGDLS